MWNLSKGNIFLRNVSIKKLQNLYKKEKNDKAKLRLLAAIKRKQNKSIDYIAFELQKPRSTIDDWLNRFEKRNIKGTYDKERSGRPSQLTNKQLEQLKKDLNKGPRKCGYAFHQLWTRKLMEDLLTNKYKISYSDRHARRLLNDVGFSFIKPRINHYKGADKRSKERFKKHQKNDQTLEERRILNILYGREYDSAAAIPNLWVGCKGKRANSYSQGH